MEIDRNFFTRLPDFIFGMYCFQYVKKINIYQFIGAIFICLFVLFTGLKIPIMYHITIVGFSLFIILAFIGQHIHQESIKNMFMPISKYSYAIFLVHHVILYQLMAKFKGMTISAIESYCLFTIACILIAIISWYLYKMHSKIRTYLDGYFNMTAYAGASTNNTR
jgi:peptidoglycan/LPS O-acetylase OafA/YrhL